MARFTEAELRDLAGSGAFERGCDYYQQGLVGELEIRDGKALALVSGTDLYRVEIDCDSDGLDGRCTCPASDGIFFCKHCVATALALRDSLVESTQATTGHVDDRTLHAYLDEQHAETLRAWLIQALQKEPLLKEKLYRQARLASNTLDAMELKRSITRVTPLEDIFEWGRVSAYFRRLEETLDGIVEIADQLAAEDLLETALHGIRRVDKVLERIDDSGGYREYARQLLRELHRRALKRLEWTPQRRAEHLLELALADPWDQFEGVPLDYADVLGDAGLSAFYVKVEHRFDALPQPSKQASFEDRLPYLHLRNYLMMRAKEQGDVDELIRLEKLTAATVVDFERIARLYLEKGDSGQGAHWLSKADAMDKDDRTSRKALWATLHVMDGDWEAAIEAQTSAFQRDARYDDYRELMTIAKQADRTPDVRHSVFEFLQSREQALSWSDERRAWTLACILKDEQDWHALKETALTRIGDADSLLKIARWIANAQLADAAPVFEKAVDALVRKKTNRSYRAAVRVLHDARSAFEASGSSAFAESVARLRKEHFRKRNFMAALDAEFGPA